jgi:uncharacterized protein (DUF2249 family)
MITQAVVLDVRDDIRRGREPFSKIMLAVGSLAAGQDLIVIAPFEPTPLYNLLAQQGLQHSAEVTPEGDYKVRFGRRLSEESGMPQPPKPAPGKQCKGVPGVEVDARGLEPPQPMVKILEAVAALPKGAQLRARTDRRPMHLYPQLAERGFVAESDEQSDGSFLTVIRQQPEGEPQA